MKLLLDTHAFLWWDDQPGRLPVNILALCSDPSNVLLVSVVTVWELQIKIQLGKLGLARPLEDVVVGQQNANGLIIVPIGTNHIYALQNLPLHH
jgi:PIN domain nuclease of toxin-antitoxin system